MMRKCFLLVAIAAFSVLAFNRATAYTGCTGDTSVVTEYIFYEGSDIIADNTGAGNGAGFLTLVNGVMWNTDVPPANTNCGYSVSLPATGSGRSTPALETSQGYNPLFDVTNFTIMAWVKRESGGIASNTAARIVSDISALGTNASGFDFRFSGTNGVLLLTINGVDRSTSLGGIPPNEGTWHHVAVVYGGTRPATNTLTRNIHFYVDGVQRGDGSTLTNAAVAANGNRLSVGNASTERTILSTLVGKIDDVRILRGFAPDAVGNGKTNDTIRCYMNNKDDFEAPTISCPANVSTDTEAGHCYASGVALGAPTISDNCGTTTISSNAPATFPLGTTPVIWTVADLSGNQSTCTQQVTVLDHEAPSIDCPAAVTVNSNGGECNATNVTLGAPSTSDNCVVAGVTNNAPASFEVGTNVVTWTVTDTSGNSNTCQQLVVVVNSGTNNTIPLISCPSTVTVGTDAGHCYASGVSLGTPTITRSCTAFTITSNAAATFSLGTNAVTWTVADADGNTNSCQQTVIVQDHVLPTITCPTNLTVVADFGSSFASGVNLGTPATGDSCGVASVTNNASATFPVGTNTVTWTVMDNSGNSNTCQQLVMVLSSDHSRDVVITELATGLPDVNQWVEIYNRGTGTVDLTNWKIRVSSNDYSIGLYQGSTTLSGSTYAVVARVATSFFNANPGFRGALLTSAFPPLSTNGGQIALVDVSTNVVESFSYITNLTSTLERRNYDWADYTSANWATSAAANGTPNKQNTRKFLRVYFNYPPPPNGSSEVDIDTAFINLVNSATGTVWCAFYQLNRQNVVSSLCDAKTNRSVDVRFATDTDYFSDGSYTNFYGQLQNCGITVKADSRSSLMHNKFAVVDGRYVWTGSWNTTDSGTTDDVQNGLILDSTSVAQAYQREFGQFWTNKFGTAKTKGGTNEHTVAGAIVKVFFSPKDGCASNVVNVTKSATANNFFEIYTFTTNSISNAIITNKNNGLTVQGYMDNLSAGGASSQYPNLTNADVDVQRDAYAGLLHHKVMIVDAGSTNNAQLVTGSFNWTAAANNDNDENLLVVSSYDIANIFYQEFLTNRGWTDTIGDGIPDSWRQHYFGSGTTTNGNSCASCDPDGDGLTNLQEYQHGTDPLVSNAISVPSMVKTRSTDNPASVIDLGGGASYSWSIDNGTITAGDGTPNVTWDAGDPGAAVLSVTMQSRSPGSSSIALSASVPVTPCSLSAVITAPTEVLVGSTNTASVPSPLTVLHSFTDGADGANPVGLVQGTNVYSNFYGAAGAGGTNDDGTLFMLTSDGTLTTLWQFNNDTDGSGPSVPVQGSGSNSNFFGVTNGGGSNSNGTVYAFSRQQGLTTLFAFNGSTQGSYPAALTQGRNGNLYGVTEDGGSNNNGLVFMIATNGSNFQVLHYFGGGTDGFFPVSALVQGSGSDSNFYGTTFLGGTNFNCYSGCGTVFRMTPSGTMTSLHCFNRDDGAWPSSALVLGTNGNFYGTTFTGGTNGHGTVFSITPQGTLTTFYHFSGSADGGGPDSTMVLGFDHNFYGTTVSGGVTNIPPWGGGGGYGTVFRVTPQGTLTTVWQFTGGADGGLPYQGGVVSGLSQGNADGYLYGVALIGGTSTNCYGIGCGTAYKINPATYSWSITNGTITAGQGTPNITWTAGSTGTAAICVTISDSLVCNTNICASATAVSPDASYNNDGIPNWWRLQYFGTVTTNGVSCASCDPDHDGVVNLTEFHCATDPQVPNIPPVVTTQPSNQATCPGSPVIFNVSAAGSGLHYHWRKGGLGWGGLGAWNLSTTSTNRNENGHFTGKSPIATAGRAWGLYANGGQTASAVRPFNLTMPIGEVFQISMANSNVQTGGSVGLALQNANGEDLWQFFFLGGDTHYIVADGSGTNATALGYTEDGLQITLRLTSPTNYVTTIIELAGGAQSVTGSLVVPPSQKLDISQVRLFNANAGPDSIHDLYFNSLNVCGKSDNAADAQYNDGWQTGDGGGWELTSAGATNTFGLFIGSSTNNGSGDPGNDADIDTAGSNSWGLWANNGAISEAKRSFIGPLLVGQTFEISLDNGYIDTGGSVGFGLQDSTGTNRFEFYLGGDNANYSVHDYSGLSRDTGIPYTSQGLRITFKLTGINSYSLVVSNVGTDTYGVGHTAPLPVTITGTLTGVAAAAIDRVRLFNYTAGNGSSHDAFFNSISVGSKSDNASSSAYTNGWTTGSDGGNSLNAPDSPTFTLSTVAASDAGCYDVVVSDDCGLAVTSNPADLSLDVVSPSAAIAVPSTVCANSMSNTASVPNAGAGANYNWTIGNGSITGGQGTPIVTWSTSTGSPVTLGVTVTKGGCASSGSTNVTVLPLPDTTMETPSSVCAHSESNFAWVPDAGEGATYTWSIQNGRIDYQDTSEIGWTAGFPGMTTLRIRVTTGDGCSTSNEQSIAVLNVPVCSISGRDAVPSHSETNSYSGPSASGLIYNWSLFGNGGIIGSRTGEAVLVTAGDDGSFELELAVTGTNGCTTICGKSVLVSNPSSLAKAAGGLRHSLFLLRDGTVWGSGLNTSGQVGSGAGTAPRVPVRVLGIADATSIAAGGDFSMALKTNGTVWAWGYGIKGSLGNSTTNSSSTPVQATGITNAVAIASGDKHAVALLSDGTVRAWGADESGQLGNGTTNLSATPVRVTGLTNVVAISLEASCLHSLALMADGTVWAWGNNLDGELGDGSTIGTNPVPVQVASLTNIVAIAAGGFHNLALAADGTVWAWGANGSGQLGTGTTNAGQRLPTQIIGLSNIVQIAAGRTNSLALAADGKIWVWGANNDGELGYAIQDINFTNVPVQAASITNVTAIASGDAWTFAVVSKPCYVLTFSWGLNTLGQLGAGSLLPSTSPGYVPKLVRTPNTFLDSDEDGLPDWLECELDTSLSDPDTDHNGIPDGDEDFDSDGLTNLQEYQFGTNPLDPDTNHNGTSDGDEDFDHDGLTNLEEFQLGTEPLNWNTAGDGLPDGWKIKYGMDPHVAYDKNADPDNDGLTNLEEANYGTDPFSADTDGDGYTDYEEVMGHPHSGGNSLAAASRGSAYSAESVDIFDAAGGFLTNVVLGKLDIGSNSSYTLQAAGGTGTISDPLDPGSTPGTGTRVAVKVGIADPDFNDDTWNIFIDGNFVVSNRGDYTKPAYRNVFLDKGQMYKFTIEWVSDSGCPAGDEYMLTFELANNPSKPIPWIPDSGNSARSGYTFCQPDMSAYKWKYTVPKVEFKKAYETQSDHHVNRVIETKTRNEGVALVPDPKDLFMVAEVTGDIEADVDFDVDPASARGDTYFAIVENGSSIVTSGTLPSSGPASFTFPGDPYNQENLQIRYGFDSDDSGSLSLSETQVFDAPMQASVQVIALAAYDVDVALIAGGSSFAPYPTARSLLRIFYDGTPINLATDEQPTSSPLESFNCFTDAYANWLTHNAGSTFADNGNSYVAHCFWDETKPFSQTMAASDEIKNRVKAIYLAYKDTINTFFVPQPIGTVHTFGPLPGSCPVLLPEFEFTSTVDLNFALGRVRVDCEQVEVTAEKVDATNWRVNSVTSSGTVGDLYDFNILAGGLSPIAATVQLGFDGARYHGQIFKDTFSWFKNWTDPTDICRLTCEE